MIPANTATPNTGHSLRSISFTSASTEIALQDNKCNPRISARQLRQVTCLPL